MTTYVKDLDGGRTVELEVRGKRVFLQGNGFCYEFDLGIFWHGIKKEVAPYLGAEDGICPFVILTRDMKPECPADIAA